MIKTKRLFKEVEIVDLIFCDKCKKEIKGGFELQEMHHINFVGGYSSVFGDGAKVKCDLCQDCLRELIGSICSIDDIY